MARVWRGWTTPSNAAAYDEFLRTAVVPETRALDGCVDAYVLRDDRPDEVEFVTMFVFRDLAAVQRFAGEHFEAAVIPAAARILLSRFDATASHYEVRVPPMPA